MAVGAHFLVARYAEGIQTTVSMVSESGRHICQFLEDKVRLGNVKVPGATAIPFGRYRVTVTRNSPMSMRYFARWPDSWYQGLPVLTWDHPKGEPMEPEFTHLRVHPLRDHADTAGCLGTATDVVMIDGDYEAEGSVRAFERFCSVLYPALEVGVVYMTIQDHRFPEMAA